MLVYLKKTKNKKKTPQNKKLVENTNVWLIHYNFLSTYYVEETVRGPQE